MALKKKAEALVAQLKPAERVELADLLYAGLPPAYHQAVERGWEKEIGRRLDEIESGKAILHSAEDVGARVRAAIDEARSSTRSRHK
jgi:putative addiction module component (TIGR02574 family)